jgi:hypothetical protein
MTAIIGFLGYNLVPQGKTLAQQLIRHRTALGSRSRKPRGRSAGPCTLARREHGEREH